MKRNQIPNTSAKAKALETEVIFQRYLLLIALAIMTLIASTPLLSAPTLEDIMDKSENNAWDTLPIGERIGKIGLEFIGTPYVAGTLDRPENEVCNVLFNELDCVTFMELTLNLARSIELYESPDSKQLQDEVTYTRYREGILDGYSSRLHYTSEWIYDNVEKEVIENITQDMGGEKIDFGLNFMSQNTKYYPHLQGDKNAENLEVIEQIEDFLNEQEHYYIPKSKVASIEKELQTGDIIAITSAVKGLDYNHIGFVYVDNDGTRRFLHASLGKKEVVLDTRLSDYLNSVDKHTGITVLRPLSPSELEADEEGSEDVYYED